MQLFEIETFVTVVREGGFSSAAKVLHRTQPAVSQIIRRLEESVGEPLFDRAGRRGVLTDAGRVLLEHGERLLNLKAQALAAVADVRHVRSGRLVILANELTCLYVLPILDGFRRQYPAVGVSVRRGQASRIPAEIADYAADLGVITYRPDAPGLASVVVYRDELAFVVPPRHRLAGRRQVRITDLGREAFVAHHVASPYRARVVDTFRKRRVALQMPIEMPTIDAIKRVVAAGHGVALLPRIAVETEIAAGDLVQVRVKELAFERPVRVIWRKQGSLSHAGAAFLAVAEAHALASRAPFAFHRD
jgi:DNA-binding transcriptional LysR family regulator